LQLKLLKNENILIEIEQPVIKKVIKEICIKDKTAREIVKIAKAYSIKIKINLKSKKAIIKVFNLI
jgi:hypothetical protein